MKWLVVSLLLAGGLASSKAETVEVPSISDGCRAAVLELAQWLWRNPELSHEEFKAAAKQVAFMRDRGFSVTEKYLGIPTAYRAEFRNGEGGATFAFCAEYDALPNVGHACGHNLICGASVAAALLVKESLVAKGISGRVVVLGCPGEERNGAKVKMAELGAVDDVDALMMSHPIPSMKPSSDWGYAGGRSVRVTYRGHGASPMARWASPKIRNPLDAQTLLYQAVALRRHYTPMNLALAGTITQAGQRANMVPNESVATYTVRSQDRKVLLAWTEELVKMAKGAAMMTGTEVDLKITGGYMPTNPCYLLSDVYLDAMATFGLVGRKLKAKELEFSLTDFGNLSQLKPGVHMHFPVMCTEHPCHSRGFAEACNTPVAYANMFASARSMAATALKFLTDAEFRRAVQDEFNRNNNSVD